MEPQELHNLARLEAKLDQLAFDLRSQQQLVSSALTGLEHRVEQLETLVREREMLSRHDVELIARREVARGLSVKNLVAIFGVPAGLIALVELVLRLLGGGV